MKRWDYETDWWEEGEDGEDAECEDSPPAEPPCPRGGCLFCDRSLLEHSRLTWKELCHAMLAESQDRRLAHERRLREVKPWATGDKPKYSQYMQSKIWQHIRKQVLGSQHCCELCGLGRDQVHQLYGTGLHLHHMTYQRLGNEHPDDLMVLCEGCHALQHRGPQPALPDGKSKGGAA